MKKTIRWSTAAWSLLLALSIKASADAGSPSSCLQTIQTVCKGQEDHLETCLAERGDQLSAGCRDILQNTITQAQTGTGIGACLEDIKTFCPGLDAAALTPCLVEKYAQFSPACQKNLDTENKVAHPDSK